RSATQPLMHYSVRLRVHPASRRGSPIYSASPSTPCRRPYPGGPGNCTQRCLHRRFCLRRISTGSTTTDPTTPNQVGSVTGLQRSLHATAWRVASPASARTFTTELSWAGFAPYPRSVITRWFHRYLPSPVFHRLDWQPYGLRANLHSKSFLLGVIEAKSPIWWTRVRPAARRAGGNRPRFPAPDCCGTRTL